jgi:ABC-type glycerol-3-phosphate transport system substrate-binding protein
MGVTVESREGDQIVIISGFYECEYSTPFNWDRARMFSIGDVVDFIDDFKDEKATQDHLAYKIKFKTEDGKIYCALPTCFVTLDEWHDLEEYFLNKLNKNS